MNVELASRCGDCKYFDRKQVDGISFGTTKLPSGEEVNKGVCRMPPQGLLMGIVNERTSCKQKPSVRETSLVKR